MKRQRYLSLHFYGSQLAGWYRTPLLFTPIIVTIRQSNDRYHADRGIGEIFLGWFVSTTEDTALIANEDIMQR